MMDPEVVTLAAAVSGLVMLIREETAAYLNWTRARAILLTFLMGQMVCAGALVLGYLPDWMVWKDAARHGIDVSLHAAGLYSVFKPLIENQALRALAAAPASASARVVRVARRGKAAGDGA